MVRFRRRSSRSSIIPTRIIRLGFWNISNPRSKLFGFFIFFFNHVKIIFFLPINLVWLMRICFIIFVWFYSLINPPLVMIHFSFCWNSIVIFSHRITPSPGCSKFSCSHFNFLKFFCFYCHELINHLSDDIRSGEAVKNALRLVDKFLISFCLKFVDVQTSVMVFHELTLIWYQVHGDISLVHLFDFRLFLVFDCVTSKWFDEDSKPVCKPCELICWWGKSCHESHNCWIVIHEVEELLDACKSLSLHACFWEDQRQNPRGSETLVASGWEEVEIHVLHVVNWMDSESRKFERAGLLNISVNQTRNSKDPLKSLDLQTVFDFEEMIEGSEVRLTFLIVSLIYAC